MAEPSLFRVGLLEAGVGVLDACTAALRNVALVGAFAVDPDTGEVIDARRLDLLLFTLSPPHETGITRLVQVRQHDPEMPIIVLGNDVRTDLAVELVKCGFEDFLTLPVDYLGLCRKVLRLLGQYHGPAFGWSLLASFQLLVPAPVEENRRRCFRVPNDPADPITATIEVAGAHRAVEVMNLSIATDGWPGGLLLAADGITAKRIPFQRWELGEEISLTLDLHDKKNGPVPVVALMVAGLRHRAEGRVEFALQYWVRRARQEPQLRKYWVNAQRMLRLDPNARKGRPE